MATSVKLTTPIPTFEEVAKSYGVDKKRQQAIARMVDLQTVPGRKAALRLVARKKKAA